MGRPFCILGESKMNDKSEFGTLTEIEQIESRLVDVRTKLTGGGLTGVERSRLQNMLVSLESEKVLLSGCEEVTVDHRAEAVALAEEYENKSNDELLSDSERRRNADVAKSIRNSIITVDMNDVKHSEIHAQQAADALVKAVELDAMYQAQVDESTNEIEAQNKLEMAKQS